MRFLRRSLTGLFLTAMTLGLLVYAAVMVRDAVETRLADEPRVPEREERVFSVNTVTAAAETLRPVLTAYGEVQSRRELELRAGASGRIVALAPEMDEGGRVEAGQLLARIDPADAEAARDRAEAVCHQCHLQSRAYVDPRGRGLADYRPGLALEDFQHYYRSTDPHQQMQVPLDRRFHRGQAVGRQHFQHPE